MRPACTITGTSIDLFWTALKSQIIDIKKVGKTANICGISIVERLLLLGSSDQILCGKRYDYCVFVYVCTKTLMKGN